MTFGFGTLNVRLVNGNSAPKPTHLRNYFHIHPWISGAPCLTAPAVFAMATMRFKKYKTKPFLYFREVEIWAQD